MPLIKKIGILFVLAGLLVCSPASAQEALPRGGESLTDAVLLEPGSYESGEDWMDQGDGGQTKYFYLEDVEPGQMIDIDAFVKESQFEQSLEVSIYDSKREHLTNNRTLFSGEGFEVSWLTSSSQDSGKYYLKLFCEHGNADFTLDVELVDRFDAGAGQDAGDQITDALKVDFGEYKGYISCSDGADGSDYYKVSLKAGERVAVRLTPHVTFFGEVRVYNNLREELIGERSGGDGAIIETVFEPEIGGDYYIEVYRDTCGDRSGTVEYLLSLEKGGEATDGGSVTTDGDGDYVDGDGRVGIGIMDRVRSFAKGLVGFLVVGAVLVVALVVVILVLKNKKKPAEEPEYGIESMPKQEPEGEEEV